MSERPQVGLMITCLADLFRPSVGFAAVKLLQDAGCDVHVPEAQTCCGQPAFNSGDRADAESLARQVITAFEPYDHVVVPSASCAGMMCRHYDGLFDESGLAANGHLGTPAVVSDRHIFNQYVIRVPGRRDELKAALAEKGIGTEVYYPLALPEQECFSYLEVPAADYAESVRAARETLALPIYPELTDEQQRYVVRSIEEFFA